MTPKRVILFFVERVDEPTFIDYCTCALRGRVDGSDVRWSGDDSTVLARDVRATLAGDFVVPENVTSCLAAFPRSAIALNMGESPGSSYGGFLVALALLSRWTGCVTTLANRAVFSSASLRDTSGQERMLDAVFGPGSRE
jgi:hypothetical protein